MDRLQFEVMSPELKAYDLVRHGKHEITAKVNKLAKTILKDYDGKKLTVVFVLNEALGFSQMLWGALNAPENFPSAEFPDVEVRFKKPKFSYPEQLRGDREFLRDIEVSFDEQFKDANVLVVDDLLFTGYFHETFVKQLAKRGPRSVKSCFLVHKLDDSLG